MPEQQLVEIAKAIGAEARIVIMDEPTASLTEREVESLFRVIARLRSEGVGVIYISHRLEEIAAVADRVTVLRDGESIRDKRDRRSGSRGIDSHDGGPGTGGRFSRSAKLSPGEVVLEVARCFEPRAACATFHLRVRQRRDSGDRGVGGSGRTQLAETIFGLTPADSGEILLRGEPVQIPSPAEAIRLGIGYVPEDRRRHGVILEMPIAANISLASFENGRASED